MDEMVMWVRVGGKEELQESPTHKHITTTQFSFTATEKQDEDFCTQFDTFGPVNRQTATDWFYKYENFTIKGPIFVPL